ncbi:Aux/IAA-ARF-dimerization [Cynara cardunculus var. scolymus]|uniref:Auxin-responsive protein n=1 Tax=Cynara cardunculus var. scolymus TaxID=59895 RepID=A0A103YBB5_CYNCS|nr:Aux/IAA-ARF-dimerization [Cynara cardunculus var. scolymus]
MESGYSRMDEEIHPQLLDLIPKERNWFLKREDDCNKDGSRRSHGHGHGGVSDEKKLELRLGPPGVEDWSLSSDAPKNYKSPSKAAAVQVPNTSQKRSAPAPVVGWPPIRSFRKNIASNSSAKQAPSPDTQNGVISNKNIVKRVEESCQKGFFVKINMNGIPIGRKVDLNAYDSYGKLSIAAITGLLDGSGEYTLVYEDNEGDRMLVGDVPWHMFVSTVKRLRVIRSTEISNLCCEFQLFSVTLPLGSKQEKIHH